MHDTTCDDIISRSNWAFYDLKQTFDDGKGYPKEGIQSASILEIPGKVKFEVNNDKDHVDWQTLSSAKDTGNYSTGHTVDVNLERDPMKSLPQEFLSGNSIADEVDYCSQTRSYVSASGAPSFPVNTDVELFLSNDDVSPHSCTPKIVMVENFQVSSVQDLTLYERYVKHDTEIDLETNWTEVTADLINVHSVVKDNKIKNTHKCTNYSLYNADLCNIPCNINKITSLHEYTKPKKLYFNADHSNEPKCK